MNMNVVLDEGAIMPVKAHHADAGWDLFARNDVIIPACTPGFGVGSAIHDTGVHIEIPVGYVGFLKSKSGLNVKHDITGEGVIDSGYTGSIVVKLYNHGNQPYVIKKGEKLIQLVILPIFCGTFIQSNELKDTDRGAGGFGSTGK